MTRPVKRERLDTDIPSSSQSKRARITEEPEMGSNYATIVSDYRPVKDILTGGMDEIGNADSYKFISVINQVDSLHQKVRNPREQVVDAEILLGITSSLNACVRAQGRNGVTASDFVDGLLRNYGKQEVGPSTSSNAQGVTVGIDWKKLGLAVSHIFKRCPGCHTMVGPMDSGFKQRKAAVRKGVRPSTESSHPEEIDGAVKEATTTDKNMATMFNILRKNKSVKLEHLVLNRNSFAQTVENLFALSFLVKDGRAEIKVTADKTHLVSPRNAASASAVASGEAVYRHFVFRFDFTDWELMKSVVHDGEELMPNREKINPACSNQQEAEPVEPQGPNIPIRKLSRNRGLVLQEENLTENPSPEIDNIPGSTPIHQKKQKLT